MSRQNKIYNPKTHRWVKKDGRVGKRLQKAGMHDSILHYSQEQEQEQEQTSQKQQQEIEYIPDNCFSSHVTNTNTEPHVPELTAVEQNGIFEKLESIRRNINQYNNLVILYGGNCTNQSGDPFVYDGFSECEALRKLNIHKSEYKTLTIIVDPQDEDEGYINEHIIYIKYLHPTNNKCFFNMYMRKFIENIINRKGLVVIIDSMRIYRQLGGRSTILSNLLDLYEDYHKTNMLIARQYFNNASSRCIMSIMEEDNFTKKYSGFSYIDDRLGKLGVGKSSTREKKRTLMDGKNMDKLVTFEETMNNRISQRLKILK